MGDTIEELNQDTCAAFALFWNMCLSWLPPEITADISGATLGSGAPPATLTALASSKSWCRLTPNETSAKGG